LTNIQPLVSVYIPTHNRSVLLCRALDSVLKQCYEHIEILVCSDGSTDDTDAVMKEYCDKYDNIIYLKNDTPLGACAARNKAIYSASGEYITGLDDDDVFHPQRITTLLTYWDDKKSFVCSKLAQKDLTKFDYQKAFTQKFPIVNRQIVTLDNLLLDNIVGNQILTKLERLKSISGFDESMPAWQDYDTWVRMLIAYGDAHVINPILYIADIDHNISRITRSPNRAKGCFKFYDRYWYLMSEESKKNAKLRKAIFTNEKLSLAELSSCFNIKTFRNWARAMSVKLGHKF